MKLLFLFLILISQSLFAQGYDKRIQSDKLIILWDDLYSFNSRSTGQTWLTLKFDLPEVDALAIMDSGQIHQLCEGQRKSRALFTAYFAKGLKELKILIHPPCNVKGKARMEFEVRSKGKAYFNDIVFDVKYLNQSKTKFTPSL